MRRLVTWIGGTVGGIIAYRLLRRRPQAAAEQAPSEPAEPDARADELREKLARSRTAESRTTEPVAEPAVEATPAEPVTEEEPAAEPESPEDRRRRVHDEGRAALDEMRSE
ncbi:MAG TPA: hypothetical protein VFU64_07545 [Gaiellaceae bacterium]|nr:hypothetical protein [Gaiellaceae bacterium]